jgi:magnesium transporter
LGDRGAGATRIEQLEAALLQHPDHSYTTEGLRLKKELIQLKRYTHPLKDALKHINDETEGMIEDINLRYLKDCLDQTIELTAQIDQQKEMIAGLMELQLAGLNNRMNQVMKMLAAFSAIFLPLSFIAGIYGMNFEWMPELSWPLGYPAILGFMGLVAISMLIWMRNKGWFK